MADSYALSNPMVPASFLQGKGSLKGRVETNFESPLKLEPILLAKTDQQLNLEEVQSPPGFTGNPQSFFSSVPLDVSKEFQTLSCGGSLLLNGQRENKGILLTIEAAMKYLFPAIMLKVADKALAKEDGV